MSQRKVIGKSIRRVPAPSVLTPQQTKEIYTALWNDCLTKDQAWMSFHMLILATNVQTDLLKELKEKHGLDLTQRVIELYAERLKQYTAAMQSSALPEAPVASVKPS